MFNLSNEKIYLIVALLVFVAIVVYLINYQIRSIVRGELEMMKKKKLKKLHYLKMKKRAIQQDDQAGMDSYIDPVNQEQYEDDQYEDNNAPARYSQNDLLQRDLLNA